jgi:hypothetical protein
MGGIHNRKSFPEIFATGPNWPLRVHESFHLAVMKRGNLPMQTRDAKFRAVNLYDVTRLKYL